MPAALLLAGCTTSSRLHSAYVSGSYSHSLVIDATRDGTLPLQVVGRPFEGAGSEETARRIAEWAHLPSWFNQARLKPISEADGAAQYRLTLVFNPMKLSVSGRTACINTGDIPLRGPSGNPRVIAAFCDRDGEMSSVVATTTATGLDDPRFREMIEQTVLTLFPLRNPHDVSIDESPILLPDRR